MKRIVAAVMLSAGLSGESFRTGGRRQAATGAAARRRRAHGSSRGIAAGDAHELEAAQAVVDVTTQTGTVRSHLSMEIATAEEGQSEAVMRLHVPQGAAVTDAVLWVNDKPMRGAFVERQRANEIYTSIVTRQA